MAREKAGKPNRLTKRGLVSYDRGDDGRGGPATGESRYTQVQRFYLSDVEYDGVKHLFVAVIYPDKGPDLKTFAKVGEQLLRTVRVPATPA